MLKKKSKYEEIEEVLENKGYALRGIISPTCIQVYEDMGSFYLLAYSFSSKTELVTFANGLKG